MLRRATAIYARWDKFDLRREMVMAVERAQRERDTGRQASRDSGPNRRVKQSILRWKRPCFAKTLGIVTLP